MHGHVSPLRNVGVRVPTMAHAPQIKIPATYMRGGTSKGVFFRLQDLPARRRCRARRATRCCCA